MSHHARTVGAAAALLLLLAGCSDDGPATRADPPAVTSGAAPSAGATATPAPAPRPSPTEDLALPRPSRVVTGTVQPGVEPGCLLLAPDVGGEAYLLLGGAARDVSPGARVRVEGNPEPALLTTCQQGTALTVTSLEVL